MLSMSIISLKCPRTYIAMTDHQLNCLRKMFKCMQAGTYIKHRLLWWHWSTLILTYMKEWRRGRFWSISSNTVKVYGWLLHLIDQRRPLLLQSSPSNQSSHKHHTLNSLLHFFVHLMVFFLRFDPTFPLFVRTASYWSEGTKNNTPF